jgi:hypothetical protein
MTAERTLLAAGCAFGALYAAALLYEMDLSPAGCCALSWPSPDPVAAGRRLAAADPKGRNPAAQRQGALVQLAAAPADADAWMQLAWADWLSHGVLTRAGARALDISYVLRPYAGGDTLWRVGFALDNWSGLTPETRHAVVGEVKLTPQTLRNQISAMAAQGVRDPTGQAEAALLGLTKPSAGAPSAPPRAAPSP